MNYFHLNSRLEVTAIQGNLPPENRGVGTRWFSIGDGGWANRNDFDSLMFAQVVADAASVFSGEAYVATDAGDQCSPRYDVIRAPAIGDEVSYGFNGDCYPCGTVVKVSKSLKRVETSEGKVFNRSKSTGRWFQHGWALVNGHHYEQNPHF